MIDQRVELMLEEWRTVPAYNRFQVSDRGRVRRLGRKPSVAGYSYKGRVIRCIKPLLLSLKRRYVDLQQKGLPRRRFSIAELVLEAFVGPRTRRKPIARHLDDNPTNNVLSNLAWGTSRDNRLDSARNGIQSAGSPWAKKVSAKLKGRPRPPDVVARIVATRRATGGWRMPHHVNR